MAKSRPSVQKRAQETAKVEKRRNKEGRKEKRQMEKDAARADLPPGVDPDIAGIVPGVQPARKDDFDG